MNSEDARNKHPLIRSWPVFALFAGGLLGLWGTAKSVLATAAIFFVTA